MPSNKPVNTMIDTHASLADAKPTFVSSVGYWKRWTSKAKDLVMAKAFKLAKDSKFGGMLERVGTEGKLFS